jgi:DNA gyrase subunit B
MPDLLEKGHVYIAQPPLYGVKLGKTFRYLKNDHEMEEYLMERATENVVVTVVKSGANFSGAQLAKLLKGINEQTSVFSKLNRRIENRELLARLLEAIAGEGGFLGSGVTLKQLFEDKEMLELLALAVQDIGYRYTIRADEEHGLHEILLEREANGSKVEINWDSLSTAEWQRLFQLYSEVALFEKPPFHVSENGSGIEIQSKEELLNYILALGKKDLSVQRYKGLAEMNPEQLWETTMDPEARTLLKVSIDDAVQTDGIFTILMGDAVEPRRRFIEDNALNVRNLDI